MDLLTALDGRQLPQPGRLITRLRDVAIIDMPAANADESPNACTRTAIVFTDDQQADPRIFDVLLAFHYRAFKHRVATVGLAKVRHQNGQALRWWFTDPLDTVAAQRAMSDAVYAAIRHTNDKWTVEPPILVTARADGTVDRDRLPESDLLRRSVPGRYVLGTVRP